MQPADIVWGADGAPRSREFGDVYFSRGGGLEETRHVFLQHNNLPERFRKCAHFTIAETGFGTGLNFLAAWQAFAAHAPESAILHYVAFEKHPLHQHDMQRAHQLWPELEALSSALLRAYPLLTPGAHRLLLHAGRVRLSLFLGSAEDGVAALDFRADAWFLDGFAPAVNPALWEAALLHQLPARSGGGATFATFTAAGHVRRTLAEAGFMVEKVQGYGHKRDMLRGVLHLPSVSPNTAPSPSRALVIGGGAAGAAAAYALALRGTQVTVLDALPTPASATSANAAAVLYPFVSRAWMPHTRFYLTGLGFTHRQVEGLRRTGHRVNGAFCGMVQLPKPSQTEPSLCEIPHLLGLDASVVRAHNARETAALCGLDVPSGGLYWPHSGWFNMQDYARACLSHPGITYLGNATVTALHYAQGEWIASGGGTPLAQAPAAIVANAAAAQRILPEHPLRLGTVRGQITHLPTTAYTSALQTVLCFGGYLTPAQEGAHHLGATYERHRMHTDVLEESHCANLASAAPILSHPSVDAGALTGWAGLRTTTPDKLPLVGELLPGLYLSVGHGSRGALSCPLAGEILASRLHGEPSALDAGLTHALRPTRFMP